MHQTKLLQCLRVLSTRERSRWRQYVQSDFFNRHQVLRQLADDVLSYAPEFKDQALAKKTVYRRLFPADTEHNELKINNLISDLFNLLLGYMAFRQYESARFTQQLDAANALLDRDLGQAAASLLQRSRVLLDSWPCQSAERQHLEIRWWEALETLESRQARRTAGEHLHQQAEALDKAFVLEKLRLGAAQISRRGLAVLQSNEHPRWLPEIRQWCLSDLFLSTLPTVQVYLAALDLLEQNTSSSYAAFSELLDKHFLLFSAEELAALYQYALNFCIHRINDGHPEAYAETLALYRTLLDRNVLLRKGQLSQWTYKNITTTGLRSGDFVWTEQFINQYRQYLPPAEQENAFIYNMAALYFEKGEYAHTLQTLQNVEFTDFTYHLGAKIMQIKSFYLLGETEALAALVKATQQLLRRNRSLSDFGKSANLHFLQIILKLDRWTQQSVFYTEEKKEQQRNSLLEKTTRLVPLANKDWLLDQLKPGAPYPSPRGAISSGF
ncbi:MAG: hypothetical protein IT260_17270 [Saprospiraceae bacterium]|nr:hypothetical protein [Saprospiraceae bacterium]